MFASTTLCKLSTTSMQSMPGHAFSNFLKLHRCTLRMILEVNFKIISIAIMLINGWLQKR